MHCAAPAQCAHWPLIVTAQLPRCCAALRRRCAHAKVAARVQADKENKQIVIEDTGVGMTRDELLSSLGTIARSGTAKFAEAMKQAKSTGDSSLIGQFGVGFYSSFLVADSVRVQSKSNDDDKQWCFQSSAGSHKYSIKDEAEGDLKRGTRCAAHSARFRCVT
jgi:heat shock protein 90kDa beta